MRERVCVSGLRDFTIYINNTIAHGIDSIWPCMAFFSTSYSIERGSTFFVLLRPQWNLVCSKSSLPNMSQSVYFVGSLLGAWLWGTVADKIGRKKVFYITLTCTIISGLGFGLSPSYAVFVVFRLLNAISCAGVVLTSYVLSMEIVGVSARSFAGIAGSGFFAIGYPILACLAYFIRSWRWLCVVISLFGLGYYPLWK